MKLTLRFPAILLLFIALSASMHAQFRVEYGNNFRDDVGLAYNFFVGDDAEDFQTSINGFGSGFLLDIFTGRYSIDLISIGWDVFNLSAGAGVAISKYRFAEDIILEKTANDYINWYIDDDPDHDYGSGFFSYGKSKLVTGSAYFPAHLNLSLGKLFFSAGALVDVYVSGKHKRKFKDDGSKKKIVIRNDDFNNYNLNKTKYGVNALILHKASGVGVGFTYMLTPFFQEGKGPDLNEVRVSFTYDFSLFEKNKTKEKKVKASETFL